MTDTTATGDTHGDVADLLEQHDAHHGGTAPVTHAVAQADAVQDAPPAGWRQALDRSPRCHATHAQMAGVPSKRTADTLQGIINSPRGTPAQNLAAQSWLARNAPEKTEADKIPTPLGW